MRPATIISIVLLGVVAVVAIAMNVLSVEQASVLKLLALLFAGLFRDTELSSVKDWFWGKKNEDEISFNLRDPQSNSFRTDLFVVVRAGAVRGRTSVRPHPESFFCISSANRGLILDVVDRDGFLVGYVDIPMDANGILLTLELLKSN